MLIIGDGSLQFVRRNIFEGDISENTQITYSKLVLIRHAANAYQIYLQTDSDKEGLSIEALEVFTVDGKIKVFQETSQPQSDIDKFEMSSAHKDQYLIKRIAGKKEI